MKTAPFKKGLVDLGSGAWAWLQPDGGWGWSNAGLVVDGEEALLVDTLFDEPLTAGMLKAMADATGFGADDIGQVVNTHANGDHTHGNALLGGAEIIASEASAHEMAEFSPQALAMFKAQERGRPARSARPARSSPRCSRRSISPALADARRRRRSAAAWRRRSATRPWR